MQKYKIFVENIYICIVKMYIYAYKGRKIRGFRPSFGRA